MGQIQFIDEANKIVKQLYKSKSKCKSQDHSNKSWEVLGHYKFTTALDKTLIYKFYIVKGHEGNLLGK